jgi:hypothetical protein
MFSRTQKKQYNETNMVHFNLLRIKDLYIFLALRAHSQETLNKRNLVYACVLSTDITRTQHTNCWFHYTDIL